MDLEEIHDVMKSNGYTQISRLLRSSYGCYIENSGFIDHSYTLKKHTTEYLKSQLI